MSKTGTALVWFRRDLRLSDNPALHTALAECERVIPVYIHAPQEEAPWAPGGASNWWLHRSLIALQQTLRANGSELIIRRGGSLQQLRELAQQWNATHLFWNRLYEPVLIRRDTDIKQQLGKAGLRCHACNGNLLHEPARLLTQQGTAYKVFTAYWKAASRQLPTLAPPLPPAKRLPPLSRVSPSLEPEALELLPHIPWYRGFEPVWQPGEAGARQAWQRFLRDALSGYDDQRDLPAQPGTSRLSPHLHFGEISPRQMVWELQRLDRPAGIPGHHLERFLSQLGWREFAHYTLYHFPRSSDESLDRRFDSAAWYQDDGHDDWLGRWQRGETGIPIVDAGMRQLWQTGWMHNRVRMIVASLLTKNLGIHWREGARWFWDTLVDADLANNTLGWQWTAGCGVDAAPYFRVFNPARQAERFDPEGGYITTWLPQLAGVKRRSLYQGLPSTDEARYPIPMIDLDGSRKRALQRWERIKRLRRE